jgi:hypothetical protein
LERNSSNDLLAGAGMESNSILGAQPDRRKQALYLVRPQAYTSVLPLLSLAARLCHHDTLHQDQSVHCRCLALLPPCTTSLLRCSLAGHP